MKKRTTLRDIAKLAEVSHVTVGLALHNNPRISEKTRKKIQAIAKQLDYRPDPMLSALMTYRQTIRPVHYHGVLAWVNSFSEPANFYRFPELNEYWLGAKSRCQAVGYQLEEFRLADLGMKAERLSRILLSRNIKGILLPPQGQNHAQLNLQWENFSSVTFGFTLQKPRLHLVTNAQYRSSMLAAASLKNHGYRSVGLVLERSYDEKTDFNFSSGFLAEQRRNSEADPVPVLSFQNSCKDNQKALFRQWYERYKPDAILSHVPELVDWMKEKGYELKRDYGFAFLTLSSTQKGIAGIHQNNQLIGSVAVDLLVGAINRNERGVPETPLRLLVEGRWVEGNSLRDPESAMEPVIL